LKILIDFDTFHKNYKAMYHRFLTKDNRYGKVMFFLHRLISSNNILTSISMKTLVNEMKNKNRAYWLTDIVWHMFAGDKPYRRIFRKTMNLFKLIGMIKNVRRWT